MKVKAQTKTDEFAFIILGAVVFIAILAAAWVTSPSNIIYVAPSSLVFHLSPGESSTRTITLNGSGIMTVKTEGEIASWIKPEYSTFSLSESGNLHVSVYVPSDASFGVYKGKLIIVSNQTKKSVDITVYVENVTHYSERTISFSDFVISYAGKENVLEKAKDLTIKNNKITFVVSFTPMELNQISSLKLRMVIDDKNDVGELYVYLNDKKIYMLKPRLGEVDIPINVSELQENNVITVKAVKPWWEFWAHPYCHVYSASLIATYNPISKKLHFSLTDNEKSNFGYLVFSALIRPTSPIPTLKIKLNDQLVYLAAPSASASSVNVFSVRIDRDLIGNQLLVGKDNTLSLSLATKGEISFSNVLLKVFYAS